MMEESLKQKREFFRFSIRKQQLSQEFQKKRQPIRDINQLKTSTDEFLNQISSNFENYPKTADSILDCLKFIVTHQNIQEIISETDFLTKFILQFFCENQYDKNSLLYYLKYFDSRLLYDDLAYLQIKEFQLEFMNSLSSILLSEELLNQENLNLIFSILQSLLIDNAATLKNYLLYHDTQIIQNIGLLIRKEQFENLKDSIIEFYYHLIVFYRNEDVLEEDELNILLQFYFSILKSKTDLNQLKSMVLYLKSGKYLMKYCAKIQNDLSKYFEFPIFVSIITKMLSFNCQKDDDIIKYYIAKIIKQIWLIFLEDNNYLTSLFNMGLLEAQMIIASHQQNFISKLGLETLKEVVECTLDFDLLITSLNEEIILQNQKTTIIEWLIEQLEKNINSQALLKLEILNIIVQKSNMAQKINLLKTKKLVFCVKFILEQDIEVEIHQQVIYLLESFILDQQEDSITFVGIFINYQLLSSVQVLLQKSKNKNLQYVLENFLQFFEFQQ